MKDDIVLRYDDFVCCFTNGKCNRGSRKECPKAVANIILWCKWFKHIDNSVYETPPDSAPVGRG